MRPLETIGFILAVPAVFALLGWMSRRAGIVFAAMSCVVLLLAAVRLGAYWQLIPLYTGVVMSLFELERKSPQRSRRIHQLTAAGVICLLLLTAAFTYVLPMFALPKPTGPYATGTQIEQMVDPVRMEMHVAGA
ncbi:MAG TPA: hypothetical protein VE195_02200, partial [Acidobacteriaceae bacterium]|nr:hypothetical protein [Acidobacteriaceae bacterium]